MNKVILIIISTIYCSGCYPQYYEQIFPNYFVHHTLVDYFSPPIGDQSSFGKGIYQDPDGKTHKGWYMATAFCEEYSLGIHPGEDWNGTGGGNTDKGQPVYAVGRGEGNCR